ncbi:beta-1,4-galactosyltransferase 1-like [Salarias fasciatus]|uniref:Beta-1,4-galactosyltransferase n=1 Tax=Salarias fasciatus TaxID=181472 RepID=A0A672II50_SALFA|nr:beta-1,4-galactosyltransferase 1-like [Salarias fasciatus]
MLKMLFKLVSLFALCGLLCFSVAVFYKNTYAASLYPVSDRNKQRLLVIHEAIQNLSSKVVKGQQENIDLTVNTTTSENATLGPCPADPPALVGPLRVEFNVKRTLEDVWNAVRPLDIGGRYRPPDCISSHKVAVIVPFRNRHEHLKHWLYYLHPILKRQQLDYGVYVINQDGDGVFNRAKLLNVGYVEALKEYDYNCFVFSDVDLVPLNDRNLYKCFDQPRHLAVAMDKFNFGLPYNGFFGGVSSLSKQQFEKINGFPNTYWGWGGEDDDLYNRVNIRGMSVSRPDLLTGKYKMVVHQRDLHNEPNPKNPGKLVHTRWSMDKDGLNTLKYKVVKIEKEPMYSFITVDIEAPPA